MRFQTLADWLHWQESLHSSAIDLGLTRVREVAERMQLLQPQSKVVSVAGTNGKGSCVATLEALLLASNVTVGSFTSPHFIRYNERIRINGEEVSDQILCDSFARIDQARGDISLTYFEFGTLATLDIMQRAAVDVMLLEVGLGGRLDAVNIMDADVSVVTSIALDHMDWLGSDLDVIGFEKAGIYRSQQWAICADSQAPQSVADYAHDIGAYWIAMGLSLQIEELESGCWDWQGVDAAGNSLSLTDLPKVALPINSVAAALQAFVLLGYAWPNSVEGVLQQLQLTGRNQMITWRGCRVMLDVAHNPAAAQMLAERLAKLSVEGGFLESDADLSDATDLTGSAVSREQNSLCRCVMAIMSDKDRAGVLQPLLPQVQHWYLTTIADLPRSTPAEVLKDDLQHLDIPAGTNAIECSLYDSVANALEAAVLDVVQVRTEADPPPLIVVMGSFFTVAAALQYMGHVTV